MTLRDLVLLKLGGSLITDKRSEDAARHGEIRRLAGEIAEALGSPGPDLPALLLGHGSGSFGHVAARRHGFSGGSGADPGARLRGAAAVQAKAAELHRIVVAALAEAGVPAFSAAPSSFLVARAGRPVDVAAAPIAQALASGLVPVVYGDVVLDRESGAAICSTESVLAALAAALPERGFRPVRAAWLGETDGVLGLDGATIPEIRPGRADAALAAAGGAAGADVTGGMAHRVETALLLARRGVESWIADGRRPGQVARALGGLPAGGTRVVPDRAEPGATPGASATGC